MQTIEITEIFGHLRYRTSSCQA